MYDEYEDEYNNEPKEEKEIIEGYTVQTSVNIGNKADMFTKRTIKPYVKIDRVDTASEALAVSLSERAAVDMEYMSELTGKTEDEIYDELKGVIFLNPLESAMMNQPKYLTADDYRVLYRYKIKRNLHHGGKFTIEGEFVKENTMSEDLREKLLRGGVPGPLLERFMGKEMIA